MRLNAVSIHPLLKLIQIDEAGVINLPCFNTSHVKVNQYRYYSALVFEYRFNTSHVKVNHRSECSAWVQGRVSIHPMLKLIGNVAGSLLEFTCFNTSHVKVNPSLLLLPQHSYSGFNTSHVKVNPTYFLHSIQYTIPDSPVFINVFKIFTSHRAICQKNLQNHRNATVFADSRNFALIGGW